MSQLPRRTPHSVRASRLARARIASQLERGLEQAPPEARADQATRRHQDPIRRIDRSTSSPPPAPAPAPTLTPARQDLTIPLGALQQLDQQATQAIALNRAYQKKLVATMTRLAQREHELTQFKLLLDQIEPVSNHQRAADQSSHDDDQERAHHHHQVPPHVTIVAQRFKEVALPWFKHFHGKSLPPNRDAKIKEAYLTLTKPQSCTFSFDPHRTTLELKPFPTGSTSERFRLKQEVATQISRRQHLRARHDDPDDPIQPLDPNWIADSIDWDAIALVFPRHTSIDCRLQYLQHDHPRINVQPWTESELDRLYTLYENSLPNPDLSLLSTQLGTDRTPSDCLRQLRRRPYQSIRPFDAEEDAKLVQGLTLFGQDWQALSTYVGRPANALITRWTKTLEPSIKKGKFTVWEDQLLLRAVERWGIKKWRQVSSIVPGRTDAQCRERWCNHLDPNVVETRRKKWSTEEDRLLITLRGQGLGWSTLAKKFKGRTDNACLVRWKTLEAQAKRNKDNMEKEGAKTKGSTNKRIKEVEVEPPGRRIKKRKMKPMEVQVQECENGES
ncbi:BQ2448_4583 [Microbotryum intermedium]|uniref:BQ2448_4583 protein n=1 Tax=Microbotryum intermedium TaxID=269621 RepID=A0A238FGG0_9BASI|nr:BQ2448_4583 [Microbotryum intermedium]